MAEKTKSKRILLFLINFSVVILIHKTFYLDSSDMSYLSTLMALLIHLDLFSKHMQAREMCICSFVYFESTSLLLRCISTNFEHVFSSPVQWGYLSITKGGDRSWPE